jgi:hypothetical protein
MRALWRFSFVRWLMLLTPKFFGLILDHLRLVAYFEKRRAESLKVSG